MRRDADLFTGSALRHYAFALFFIWILGGCSIQKIAVRSKTAIMENGLTALFEEEDLQIARTAEESELKLLEAFSRSDPENERLKILLCQGYASYALGFVEDEDKERAALFYRRARDYGFGVLGKNKRFQDALKKSPDELKAAAEEFGAADLEALFWTANSWGLWINTQRHSPAAMAELPKVKALMERVMALDASFYYGGPYLFMGLVNCIIPKMLGGNPEAGKEFFEKALSVSNNKFLIIKVFYAQYYAVQAQDGALFARLLGEVLNAPVDILPEQKLVNAVAKRKAEALLGEKENLFISDSIPEGAYL
jgi:hypothetical protein